jgi:putative component of membrane protein insertase Oxa1/YidC/SpoIIIJ protein YidD
LKALTILQPWASLLAIGEKLYETRSWATKYRGPIAIHAGKQDFRVLIRTLPVNTQKAMYDALCDAYGIKSGAFTRLTAGAIIATAELIECHCIVQHGSNGIVTDRGTITCSEQELIFGDFTPGRYAWAFANMKLLPEPIPARGHQRLWEWERIA